MNRELPDVQVGFRKGRESRDQIANICWIIEKEFQKNIYFCLIDYTKAFVIVWITTNSGKFFKLGFSSMQTENFQMFKLVLEKAEEPEIKMPTSEKAKEFHTVLTVWITTNCGKVLKR